MDSLNCKIFHIDTCAICYERYEKIQPNDCLILKCGHIFHENCVKEWIEQRSNCPMCTNKAILPILKKDLLKEVFRKTRDGPLNKILLVNSIALLLCTVVSDLCLSSKLITDEELKGHQYDIALKSILFLLKLSPIVFSVAAILAQIPKLNEKAAKRIDYRPPTNDSRAKRHEKNL